MQITPINFWIFVSNTGMPLAVQKCDFKPTIAPSSVTGEWINARKVVIIDWKKIWNEVTAEGFILKEAKEDRYLKDLVEKLVQGQLTGGK